MADIPRVREITPDEISQLGSLPTPMIKSDDDIIFWKSTQSYSDYKIFLNRLNEAVVGYYLPWEPDTHSKVSSIWWCFHGDTDQLLQPVEKLLTLLDTLASWIDEIPPLKTPQRFGNLAFRTWGSRLEEVGCLILPSARC
jgi:serine/threonine-protein phosphatase 2A activator